MEEFHITPGQKETLDKAAATEKSAIQGERKPPESLRRHAEAIRDALRDRVREVVEDQEERER